MTGTQNTNDSLPVTADTPRNQVPKNIFQISPKQTLKQPKSPQHATGVLPYQAKDLSPV